MVTAKTYACLLASTTYVFAQQLPNVTLPWGIWQSQVYDNDDNIYYIPNVRFGAQPVRFGAPDFPTNTNSSVQDGTYGPSCIQIDTSNLKNPPGGRLGLNVPQDSDSTQSEDCLFLDIYAPMSNFDDNGVPQAALPVIVWFYGGAYAFGSKDFGGSKMPLYTGQSVLAAQDYQAIFVVGNYRLGAFGWLAGNYMEGAGQPNAGLYDQALLLSWVQRFIAQVGGDPTRVSAWGESAGAGSILHHLIREGGTRDPQFDTFLVQSPAFEWSWDNSKGGTMDTVYRNFSQLAGCGYAYNISCLRGQKTDVLVSANQNLFANIKQTGLFPLSPSVDGKWIKNIPSISFAAKKFWPNIKSALISHVYNETASFTPTYVVNQATFDYFLNTFLPEKALGPVRDTIRSTYNCTANYGGDFRLCLATLIRDSCFTCNTRYLFDAYSSSTLPAYMLRYAFYEDDDAVHASDLIPLFMNSYDEAKTMLEKLGGLSTAKADYIASILDGGMSGWYQDYLSSFGTFGDPNTGKEWLAKEWDPAVGGSDQVSNVLEIYAKDSERFISDDQNTKTACDFWVAMAKKIQAPVCGPSGICMEEAEDDQKELEL